MISLSCLGAWKPGILDSWWIQVSIPPFTDTPSNLPSLNSSTIFSNVQKSTPSCPLINSIILSCIKITCGFPLTCGWILIWKTKTFVLAIQGLKLLFPHSFNHIWVDVPISTLGLERRPVVKMPIRGHFYDLAGFEAWQGCHPGGSRRWAARVRFSPLLRTIWDKVHLWVVMHKRVVVFLKLCQ